MFNALGDQHLHQMHVPAKITGDQIKYLEERILVYYDLRQLAVKGTEQVNR